MDILLLILLFLLLKTLSARKTASGELGVNALLPVRGICAMLVLLHHVSQRTSGAFRTVFGTFHAIGYLPVAVFFAISGFALSVQLEKRPQYLRGFLKKRYRLLFLPYLFATVIVTGIYGLSDFLGGESLPNQIALRIYHMFRNGDTILPFSWYAEILAVLYLLFYCACRFARQKKGLRLGILTAGMVAVVLLCRLLGYGEYWYNSIFAFLAGVLYYEYSNSKYYAATPKWLGLSVSGFFCVLFFVINILAAPHFLWVTLSACAGAVWVFQLMRVVTFHSRILEYLGSRSYEIYLCQGIPILLLSGTGLASCGVLYFLAVLLADLLLAEGLHRLCNKIQAVI